MSYGKFYTLHDSLIFNIFLFDKFQLTQFDNFDLFLMLQILQNKFVLQGTIICLQLDSVCLILMNVSNISRIPFSQLIISQLLTKDLFLDLKQTKKSPIIILQLMVSIFLIIYSFIQIELDIEHPQLLITLCISLYCCTISLKPQQSQPNVLLTEISNTNRPDNLKFNKNTSQFDLDQNLNSACLREAAINDSTILETTYHCLQYLNEGLIILGFDSENTHFPYSIKYSNQATKTIFGKEMDSEILNLLENLTIFTGNDHTEGLQFTSQYQIRPSYNCLKQIELKDQFTSQHKNSNQDSLYDQLHKYQFKQVLEMLFKYRLSTFCNNDFQTSQTIINTENFQLLELTFTLNKNNIIIICRDITHRQKIRYLREYDKQKSKMLSFVSHEYRSPLNCIIQMLESVINDQVIQENQDLTEQLQVALDNSSYILNLSNDLLDLAQIKNGKFRIDKVPFNLETLIYECMKMFELKAKMKKVQLKFNLGSQIPKVVFSDRSRIKQILINLLSNAFKFTQNGKVTINVQKINLNILRIGVMDEGIGISDEDQMQLFKAFSKVNSEESKKLNQQGVGLGLVISNQIAQTIGSTGLNLESSNKKDNHYSNFYFDLPLEQPLRKKVSSFKIPEISLQVQEVEEIASFKQIHTHIKEDWSTQQICQHYLIVDDDCFNIFAMKRLFQQLQKNNKYLFQNGFDVDSALSGQECMEKIKNKKCSNSCQGYKIVFMDIEMPFMNGQEASQKILSIYPNYVIVGCSGYSDQQEYEKCIRSGMSDFIVKPINEIQLIQIIRKFH
ncbi:unnamed protein product (macronuclear) [Paramecium tetraurelia]|uniref:Uncharacterized protein n=1 Tax=Paramecium tetraurelia TaxID=5888 RepID=A0DWA9_PARTE|nr:uncharacterized protein GSPATT00020968001 [Paramecium tetraurelia]CAK87326.1 unnamed protein product [Paramecium tetraurelia]|eukprot:XP_001454723.1 hypothetical protein (macronuclear) [Paramecium tetraurelia strain d4-2]